jgi:hypothetical protein
MVDRGGHATRRGKQRKREKKKEKSKNNVAADLDFIFFKAIHHSSYNMSTLLL